MYDELLLSCVFAVLNLFLFFFLLCSVLFHFSFRSLPRSSSCVFVILWLLKVKLARCRLRKTKPVICCSFTFSFWSKNYIFLCACMARQIRWCCICDVPLWNWWKPKKKQEQNKWRTAPLARTNTHSHSDKSTDRQTHTLNTDWQYLVAKIDGLFLFFWHYFVSFCWLRMNATELVMKWIDKNQ